MTMLIETDRFNELIAAYETLACKMNTDNCQLDIIEHAYAVGLAIQAMVAGEEHE